VDCGCGSWFLTAVGEDFVFCEYPILRKEHKTLFLLLDSYTSSILFSLEVTRSSACPDQFQAVFLKGPVIWVNPYWSRQFTVAYSREKLNKCNLILDRPIIFELSCLDIAYRREIETH
jgi:hypothetical protein